MGNNGDDKNLFKDLTSFGMAQLKKHVFLAILPILPYILIIFLVIIAIVFILFGVLQQANDVISTSGDIGERLGNAFTLYGFRTEAEVEANEEVRFYKRIDLYKNVFTSLTMYDWALGIETLLYEGNYSEKMYLASSTDTSELSAEDILSGDFKLSDFFKDVGVSFSQGFTNSFLGNSKYKKANKNLLEVVMVMSKCHALTDKGGIVSEAYKKCYEGFLLAEFNVDYDIAIEKGQVEPEVENGHLVSGVRDTSDLEIDPNQSFLANTEAFISQVNDMTTSAMFGVITGSVFQVAYERMRYALNLYINGRLAGDSSPNSFKEIFTTLKSEHYYYNGYIVKYLKEYYKIENVLNNGVVDTEKLYLERRNKKKIADDIFDTLLQYCRYGDSICDIEGFVNGTAVAATGSAESQSSVSVNINGVSTDVSFNDYVLLYATNVYGDELKKAIESGNQEKIKAILLLAKQNVYSEVGGVSLSNPSLISNKNFDDTLFSSLSDADKQLLRSTVENYLGKTIRSNGKISTITNAQAKAILAAVDNGLDFESAFKSVLGSDAGFSSGFQSPILGNYHISSGYDEWRDLSGSGTSTAHHGIDFAAAEGTAIYSVSDGIVVDVVNSCGRGSYGNSCGGGFGNRVYVAYNNGDGHTYYVIYGHMQRVGNVKIGDTVSAGSVLGYVGSSGSSTGDHLHLEVRVDSTNSGVQTVNPSTFFGLGV